MAESNPTTGTAGHVPQAASSSLGRSRRRRRRPAGSASGETSQASAVQVDTAVDEQLPTQYQSDLCVLQPQFVAEIGLFLQIKEINDFIMQNIAYLSGGRGRDNAWIITFPENCHFRCIPQDVLSKVLIYLTSIVRQDDAHPRFTIILDRRMDTWTSVKLSLEKISASFPGNLHLVLVLRPTSFLQRTFTDIGFRFSQEDFMLKLPVVMLSSVSDLLKYIDDKQLTPELGGTLQYCHSEWIIFRNAIENFALTVKEMAQLLQSFGTELAETELPDDIASVEEIIAHHTERYHLLKSDISAVTKEGKVLLKSLEVPEAQDAVSSSLSDPHHINGDWQTINKLLIQVSEMEVAFDGFWEKHQQKMEQYVELWKFEQDFHKLVSEVELFLNQKVDVDDVAGNLSQMREKLKKKDHVDENSQGAISKAQFLILHGHKLTATHHYALDLICQRCNELRYLSDILSIQMKSKEIQLNRTCKIQKFLQQTHWCCNEGECDLSNQDIDDNFEGEEDAEKALQDIQNFLEMALPFINGEPENFQFELDMILPPELKYQMQALQLKVENTEACENQRADFRNLADNHPSPVSFVVPDSDNFSRSQTPLFSPKQGKKTRRHNESNLKVEVVDDSQETSLDQTSNVENDNGQGILKNHVLNELVETERVYVRELFTVLLGYMNEMDNPAMLSLIPPLLRSKRDVLFGNMTEIYEFHNNIFMNSLEDCLQAPERVGLCFLEMKDNFQIYATYCQNKPKSELLWRKYSECAFFQECQRKLKHRLGLDSYLLKPVQRITKYQLLLKELLKYSKGCEGVDYLQMALDSMLDILKSLNDSMHQTAIIGYSGNLNDLGSLIMQGSFSVCIGHKKGATKMKDFARFRPMQRHIFLYEHAVLFCKRRMDTAEDSDKYPFYTFKHSLKMDEVGITEYVKGDTRKFEIWCGGKEEIYILQAPNVEVKLLWLKEIRTILLKQQEIMTARSRGQRDRLVEPIKFASKPYHKKHGAILVSEAKKIKIRRTVDVGVTASTQAEASGGVPEMLPRAQVKAESEEWSGKNLQSP